MQTGRRGGAALAVNGGVVLERGGHGRLAFGEASEMCREGAASGRILWGSPLLRKL